MLRVNKAVRGRENLLQSFEACIGVFISTTFVMNLSRVVQSSNVEREEEVVIPAFLSAGRPCKLGGNLAARVVKLDSFFE
jgi:hypothetical protein